MREALAVYFDGEKAAGTWLALIGLAAVAWAVFIWRRDADLRGLMWTLGVVGVLQVAVGAGLALKTPPQVADLAKTLGSDAAAFYAAETPRMQRVQRNFLIIEVIEILILAGGVGMAMALKQRQILWGVGLGLVIQASVMLLFDAFAEHRGARYLGALVATGPAR